MIDLKPFCGTEPFRPYLHKPFSVGEFTYATDGCLMVRVARRPDTEAPTKDYKWDAPLAGMETATFAPMAHSDLPSLPVPTEADCEDCCGRGHEHDCPDCGCTCEQCGGSGKEMVVQRVSTTVRGGWFNLRYVALMLGLPNVEIMTSKRKEASPLLFRFDGGVGCIMPCRSKLDEHVEIEIRDAA